jgi:uncharacterized membrane protein YuzA (DUF378 family)
LQRRANFTDKKSDWHYIQIRSSSEEAHRGRCGRARVGALNGGLAAVARVDLGAALFGLSVGEVSALTTLVYGPVGVAGLYQALFWKRVHNRWMQPASDHA